MNDAGGILQNMALNPKPFNFQPFNFLSRLGSFASNFLPFGNLLDTGIGLVSQISNNLYDRKLQQELFRRDDTTLDRQMAMYERNGVNPLLAVPQAQVTNTKGFEPSSIQTNFNQSWLNHMQKKTLQQQSTKMWLDNALAREDLEIKKNQAKLSNLNAEYEGELLKAKINGAKAYRQEYYSDKLYDFPFEDVGVYPLEPKTFEEKLIRQVFNVLGWIKDKHETSKGTSSSIPKEPKVQPTEQEKWNEYTKNEQYNAVVKVLNKGTVKGSGFEITELTSGRNSFLQWRETDNGYVEVSLYPGTWEKIYNDNDLYKYLYENGWRAK